MCAGNKRERERDEEEGKGHGRAGWGGAGRGMAGPGRPRGAGGDLDGGHRKARPEQQANQGPVELCLSCVSAVPMQMWQG